jgi:hypothetical protein
LACKFVWYKKYFMENKSVIALRRSSEWMNKARSFKVFIDGNEAGRISNGATEEYAVSPGTHKVICKIDWCSCREMEVTVKEGEKVYLHIRSGMKYYWHFSIPLLTLVSIYLYHSLQRLPKPLWLMYALIVVALPAACYFLYYSLISRKDYLLLSKDDKW